MKERGGGNGSNRPRWAGDSLLEIWGAQSCWLIWSVFVQLWKVQRGGGTCTCASTLDLGGFFSYKPTADRVPSCLPPVRPRAHR